MINAEEKRLNNHSMYITNLKQIKQHGVKMIRKAVLTFIHKIWISFFHSYILIRMDQMKTEHDTQNDMIKFNSTIISKAIHAFVPLFHKWWIPSSQNSFGGNWNQFRILSMTAVWVKMSILQCRPKKRKSYSKRSNLYDGYSNSLYQNSIRFPCENASVHPTHKSNIIHVFFSWFFIWWCTLWNLNPSATK